MPLLTATLSVVATALAVDAGLRGAAALANASHRPVAQALARLVTLAPAYLHELAHAAASIACTGKGRIRLHSVRADTARAGGLVALGSSDIYYRGPLTNAIISAAPALLLWPGAGWLAWQGGGALVPAAWAGVLVYAGRLSATDLAHLRALRRGG